MSIKADVDRGLEIRDQMEKLKTELKQIEARLQQAGLDGDQVELNDADREGRQFLAQGSSRIVPVVLTADLIVGEFLYGSPRHAKINMSIQDTRKVLEFFKPVRKFENLFDSGKKFRARAVAVFGQELAPKFITACVATDKEGIAKSSIKIAWDESKAKV
ncbi:MAG TPA: hypothetical protein VK742_20250 [Candidatus Sulfotelmatobacter sp.]|jgi:hypothetical protein|nr:hypothetical protein [Candidatus Sulfotelmatobacter sp.]